jgi:hypothetical protein
MNHRLANGGNGSRLRKNSEYSQNGSTKIIPHMPIAALRSSGEVGCFCEVSCSQSSQYGPIHDIGYSKTRISITILNLSTYCLHGKCREIVPGVIHIYLIDLYGARDRDRTGTVSPPRDFKSLASTNFATRAFGPGVILQRGSKDVEKKLEVRSESGKTSGADQGFGQCWPGPGCAAIL